MNEKRILSFILALVMVLGMVPFNALDVFATADGDSSTQDWSLIQHEGTWYLDILNGHIADKELYAALSGQSGAFGTPNPSIYASDSASYTVDLGWLNSLADKLGIARSGTDTTETDGGYRIGGETGFTIQSDDVGTSNLGLQHNTVYSVEYAVTTKDVEREYGFNYNNQYYGTKYNIDEYSWTASASFTVRYYYEPTVVVTGKDGVTVTNVTEMVYHGDDVTFTLPAMGNGVDEVWVAEVEGLSDVVVLSHEQDNVITVNNIASKDAAEISVTLSTKEVYAVTVGTTVNPSYGSSVTVDKTSGVEGTVVTITAVPKTPADGVNNEYYYVEDITVTDAEGNDVTVTDNKFTLGASSVTVVVTFGAKILSANATPGNVEFNPGKSVNDQLEDLQKAIFAAVVSKNDSVPNTIDWDDVNYEYYAEGNYTGGLAAKWAGLADAPTVDVWLVGEVALKLFAADGVGSTESIRITGKDGTDWAGLYVEADITLTEGRKYTIIWVDEDGTELYKAEGVVHNNTYVYEGDAPTKPEDTANNKVYEFCGWDSNGDGEADVRVGESFPVATGDVTYKACYTESGKPYHIVFQDWDGTLISEADVPFGTVPTAPVAGTDFAPPAYHTFAGWDSEVIAVNGIATYTATYSLVNNTTGDVYLNPSLSGEGKLTDLKTKVLTAAGLPTNGNFTVYMVTGAGEINVESSDWGDIFNMYSRFNVGDSQDFIIKHNDTAAQGNITVSVKDSRLAATVDELAEDKKDFGKFDELSDFQSAVKPLITASWKNHYGETGKVDANSVILSGWTQTGKTKNAAGETVYTYSVNVSVIQGTNWLASAAPVTIEGLTWTVNQYEITWVDGNGNELYSENLDYGAMPSYTGATPTKDQTVSTTYTFKDWGTIETVSGDKTYTAQFTEAAREYEIHWDTNGDGTVDTTTNVAYGTKPQAPAPADKTTEDKSFSHWESNGNQYLGSEIPAVTGSATYTAKYSDDQLYTVKFMVDGELYQEFSVNFTQKESIPSCTKENPDKENAIFNGWTNSSLIGTVLDEMPENNVVILEVKWNPNDTNDNNKDDADETITVTQTGGTVTVNGNVANGAHVYNSTLDAHTIVITPAAGYYVKSLKINGTPFDIQPRAATVSYNNGVLTLANVTLENGMTIEVEYAEHKIPATDEPYEIPANGFSADTKLAAVTKEAVLKAVLGEEKYNELVAAGQIDQFDVKMYINIQIDVPELLQWLFGEKFDVSGYHDIWNLSTITSNAEIQALIKSTIARALDTDEAEMFEITWAAHDQYPKVVGEYEVSLKESRQPTTVEHNGHKYLDAELNQGLLDKIKADLINFNTEFVNIKFKNPNQTLTLGATNVPVVVIVTVKETEEFYGADHEVTVYVDVPTENVEVKIPGTATVYFNTGMTTTDKIELLKSIVKHQYFYAGTEILVEAGKVTESGITVEYLASTARNVPYTINIAQLDLGLFGDALIRALGSDTITVEIPVGDLWLSMTTTGNDFPVYDAPSNDLIRQILVEDLIPRYGADYLTGNISADQLKDIAADLLANHPDIANYYKYLGAHQFGELENETIHYIINTNYGSLQSNNCNLSMVDDRDEVTIKLNTGVVVYNNYTEESLLALILDGVYANGQEIDGLTVDFVTDVNGLPASDATEVTVKFVGNKDYKPATATVAIKINKAPVTVSVDNRLFHWHDGFTYSLSDVILTNPAGVDTINFVAGLDVHDVNLDGGLKGFVAKIQLMLPEDLQSLLASADALLQNAGLNVSFADGASMKLSELLAAVDALDRLFAGTEYEEYFRVLLNMLQSLPTDVADIEIVIGGALPTDIGVYVVGAISADANYTTDFGVGAVVIYPDGTKVDLAWNQNDDNYIVTNSLLTTKGADGKYLFDAGATAFVRDTNYTEVDPVATEQVAEIFLGVDIDGNITLEMDQTKLNVGAYIEVAMAVEWGNEMYYSVPIVRPIVVVAETLNVDFRDDNGNVNNERHFEFFNVAQDAMEKNLLVTYKKDGNGYKAGDEVTDYSVKFFYVGVQTNGKPYTSTQAPVHAGVYTLTAVVTLRDAAGAITHAGQGIGALVIEPSKSTIDVENEAIKWDGNEHNFNQYVHADSVNTDLIPDTTVITVGISADLNANIGLDAIEGTFNVDLPAWMDELMKKLGILEAGYTDAGITVAQFKSYVQKLEEAMAELGVETDAFDKIVDVIGQMSDKATLTFHDDKGYTDIGAYLVIGIVTDSDHWPAADAGIVVIYPDGEKAELKYAETWDDNNVFTWNVLQHYDLNAEAYLKGEFSQDLTDKTLNLFVGFADHGELILTKNKAELDNGIYAEVSFLLVLDNVMYYAEPIAREVIIVPNPADVDFLDDAGNVNNDRHFQFTNQAHAMDRVKVTLADGTELILGADDERLDILYVGVQLNGKPYASAEAPVHAGVYEVTAQYTERKDGKVYNLGIGIGMLVIEPSKSETVVDNGAYPYGETHHVNDLVHVSSVNVPSITPDTTVISAGLSANLDTISGLSSINGTVNVDLPAWMDDILNKLNILDAGYADGISRETFLSYVEKIESGLKELGVETDAFAEITNVIKQLPVNTNLTFQDNIGYTNIGAYLIIAVVTDSDHYPSVGAGVMVIYPDTTKAELRFEEDWNGNNIFTWSALQSMNLEAMAYVNGVESVEASKYVTNLYVGFTSDGTVMLEAVSYGEHVKDLPEFKNGVYSQIAVLLDLGNQLYYAEPISRAFMIVPTPANIEFVGENVFTFDNQTHALDVQVTINGAVVTDLSGLELHYTGIMTNGKAYASNEAPAHAGVYVVTASYTVRDEHDRLVTLGVAVGSLVIKPAKAEIDVTSKTHEYDGNGVSVQDMVIATSPVAGLTPDHIVISAGIKANAVLDGNLLNAINGTVNIDLPDWADRLLSQVNGTQDGVTVAGVLNAIEAVEAKIEELAAEAGVTVDVDAFDGLKKVLAQLDPAFTVSFNENAAYQEVGAYLVIGVVADANHMPAMDAGVLVIYPDVDQAELHWKYEDSNNIFTLDTLAHVDLGAYATVNGAESDAVPFQVLYLGVNANTMEIVLTRDQAELTVGNYTEFAYVLDIGSQMYVAEPIVRNLTIVQNMYEVQANDATFTYDGTGKVVEMLAALNQAGQDISDKGQVFVNYMGLTYGLDGYMSQTAPVNAGQYKAVITFVTYDDQGFLSGVGSTVVNLTINRADPDFDVQDAEFTFDGTEKEHGLVNNHGVDYIAVIETEDGVNLMMTDGLQKLADFLDDKATYDLTELKEAIEKAIQVVEGLELNSAFVDEVLKTIEDINNSLIYKITVNGANPVDAGTYKAYAITVPTANYDMDVSQGALVIEPKEVTITVADETITAGETPKLNYTVDGLVNGDDLNVIVTVDGDYSVSGTYDITATYTADPNYKVTVVNGKLTVEEKATGTIIHVGCTLSLTGEVFINNYVTVEGFEGIDINTNGGLLMWNHEVSEEEAVIDSDSITAIHTGLNTSGSRYSQQTYGFASPEYANSIYMRVYIKTGENTYVYGPLVEFSVREYCETIIERHTTSDLKNTCIALLHYGAAAQDYFNYNTGDYANANIIDEYPVYDWDASVLTKLDDFTTSIIESEYVAHIGKTLSLDTATLINYYFTFNGTAETAELLFWDGVDGELKTENVSYIQPMTYNADNGRYSAQSRIYPAAQYGKTIYACARFIDANGEVYYSNVIPFSPEAYAESVIANSSNSKLVEVVKRMAIYGEYARIYFGE